MVRYELNRYLPYRWCNRPPDISFAFHWRHLLAESLPNQRYSHPGCSPASLDDAVWSWRALDKFKILRKLLVRQKEDKNDIIDLFDVEKIANDLVYIYQLNFCKIFTLTSLTFSFWTFTSFMMNLSYFFVSKSVDAWARLSPRNRLMIHFLIALVTGVDVSSAHVVPVIVQIPDRGCAIRSHTSEVALLLLLLLWKERISDG